MIVVGVDSLSQDEEQEEIVKSGNKESMKAEG